MALLLNLKLLFESLDFAVVILTVALLSIVQLHFEVRDFVLHIRNLAFIGLVKVVIADLRQLGGIIGAIEVEALLEHPLLVASVGVLELPPQPLVVLPICVGAQDMGIAFPINCFCKFLQIRIHLY